MMIDDHPTVSFAHIGETESRGIRRRLPVLIIRKCVRAGVHSDLAKDAHMLFAEHDPNIRTLRHVAEIFAARFRSVAQGGGCRAPENRVGFIKREHAIRFTRVERVGPCFRGGGDVFGGCAGCEMDTGNDEQNRDQEVATHNEAMGMDAGWRRKFVEGAMR